MPPDKKNERRPASSRGPGNEPVQGSETEQITSPRESRRDDDLLH